jgi:hypothetical protein
LKKGALSIFLLFLEGKNFGTKLSCHWWTTQRVRVGVLSSCWFGFRLWLISHYSDNPYWTHIARWFVNPRTKAGTWVQSQIRWFSHYDSLVITGSTNHLTNDLSNFNLILEEYKGTNYIKVGNGQGLDILHIGLAQIFSSNIHFSLPNLLHVPQIENNLIFVNKFTHDNRVFVEFHLRCFRVKDLHSENLLL